MPDKHGDPDHKVLEEDIHDLREDVQTLKLAYGIKETFNSEFRAVVQEETKEIKKQAIESAVHFASIDAKFKMILWLLGISSAGIIGLIVLVVLRLVD